MLFYGIVEHFLRPVYLHPYFGQEGQLEGGTILIYQCLDIHSVEQEVIVIVNIKAFLWEVERLVDEISICIVHL